MALPQAFLDDYDEPFGFMDFASVGTMSKVARRRLEQSIELMSGAGGKLVPVLLEQFEATKALTAELIGTDPEHVALVSSTSAGLFAMAFGLPRGNVVVPATDFPANKYPWIRAADEGRIELRWVSAPGDRYTPEVFADAIDDETVAVAISHVDYRTGYRIDVEGLRRVTGDALVIVDAVQSLGALQSPMAHADVLVAGGQKWLRSGIGVAVMAMSDRALDRVDPTLSGWLGVDDPFGLDEPHPHPILSSPDRYLMGSPPINASAGLRGSLESLRKADPADVEAAVLDRAMAVEEEVRASGGEVLCSWEGDERSGILTFRLPDEPSSETNARLQDAGFVLTDRNGWLRASPHATTDPEAPAALGKVLRDRSG